MSQENNSLSDNDNKVSQDGDSISTTDVNKLVNELAKLSGKLDECLNYQLSNDVSIEITSLKDVLNHLDKLKRLTPEQMKKIEIGKKGDILSCPNPEIVQKVINLFAKSSILSIRGYYCYNLYSSVWFVPIIQLDGKERIPDIDSAISVLPISEIRLIKKHHLKKNKVSIAMKLVKLFISLS